MARWVDQTLKIDALSQIELRASSVEIGCPLGMVGDPSGSKTGVAVFYPQNRDDANAMAIALRLAAKRLEDIGKGLQ